MSHKAEPLTLAELCSRPVITVDEYRLTYGIARGKVYDLIAAGSLKVVRCGARILIPTPPILRELGIEVGPNGSQLAGASDERRQSPESEPEKRCHRTVRPLPAPGTDREAHHG